MKKPTLYQLEYLIEEAEVPGIGILSIECDVAGTYGNVGIGPYEFWGAKYVDNQYGVDECGFDIKEVEKWNDHEGKFEPFTPTPEQMRNIEVFVEANYLDKFSDMIEEEAHNDEPYHPEA